MLIAPIPTLPTPSATEVESLESRRAPLRTIEPTLRAEPIQLPRAIEPIVPTLPTAPIRAPQSTVQPVDIAPQVFAPAPTPAPAIAIPSSVPLETPTREIGNTLDPAAKTITTPAPSVLTPSPNTLAGGNSNAPATGSSAKPSDSNLPGLFPPPIPALPSTVGTPGQKLDLDSLRSRARQLAGDPNAPRTIVPFPTISAPQTKTDVEKAFDKALKRPDCREAYREMGLAAVLPLIRDSIKNEGCKW
jgi:hypothetical protein